MYAAAINSVCSIDCESSSYPMSTDSTETGWLSSSLFTVIACRRSILLCRKWVQLHVGKWRISTRRGTNRISALWYFHWHLTRWDNGVRSLWCYAYQAEYGQLENCIGLCKKWYLFRFMNHIINQPQDNLLLAVFLFPLSDDLPKGFQTVASQWLVRTKRW